MSQDTGIQSVRIAVALCDRFTELLKGPTQVTAYRGRLGTHAPAALGLVAAIGVSGSSEELSSRIGEAQQIYPEIWRHLDVARAAFAQRSVDVAEYDRVRVEEGQGLGAAVDDRREKRGFDGEVYVKTAGFNADGLARARKACDALMRATPEIDWAGIAKAESDDPAAAAFTRATRTRRTMLLGLVALGVASPFLIILYMQHRERAQIDARARDYEERVAESTKPLEGAARTELATGVQHRRNALEAAHQRWATMASPDGLRAVVPGNQPCPAAIRAPDEATATAYIRTGDMAPLAFDASAFKSFLADRDHALPDDDLLWADGVLTALDKRLTAGRALATDQSQLATLDQPYTYVVIDNDVAPHITQTTPLTYTPGEVDGRAYVFSLTHARFVCAAAITARNTPSDEHPKFLDGVNTARGAEAVLHRELEVRLRQALAANLRATPP
jgi:hypothetical protein